jgi:hypothetical protein
MFIRLLLLVHLSSEGLGHVDASHQAKRTFSFRLTTLRLAREATGCDNVGARAVRCGWLRGAL